MMWDSLFKLIYGWGHRYIIEIGISVICFLLIHFVGYPFIATRAHESQAAPSIVTGNITTHGDNSGVVIGGAPANHDPHKK